MRLKLHHVNLCSRDVPAMDEFYRTVLDLRPEPSLGEARVTEEGYAGEVAFLSDGDVQVHLAERDLGVGFRTGQAVNPLDRGHLAFRTDDMAAGKRRLEEKGSCSSDYATWARSGWHKIVSPDPEGNVGEVHQVVEKWRCVRPEGARRKGSRTDLGRRRE